MSKSKIKCRAFPRTSFQTLFR